MKKASKGFTIIEITVAAAISTIIFLGAFAILLVSNKQLDVIHAKMTLQEGPREALFKMAQEIRQTAYHKIVDFGNGNSLSGNMLNFRVPVPAPDASTLVDESYAPLWAADINYSLNSETHKIFRTSTDLETNSTKQAVLANNVTALTFSRPSATSPLITIQIDAQQIFSNGRRVPEQPIQLITQAEARNP